MGQQKGKRSKSKKSVNFKPDSNYIKNAMAEFESRGGKITKMSTTNNFAKKTMFGADMQMETNQYIAEIVKHSTHSID